MILLCGILAEAPLALVQAELDSLRAPYAWFDQRRFAAVDFQFTVQPNGIVAGTLSLDGVTWDLSCFRGVYQRMLHHQFLPEVADEPEGSPLRAHCRCLSAVLAEWMNAVETTATRIVNRPAAMASNGSKPYQSQIIARSGLFVPPTLVTNDPELVHEFRARHGKVIYKSLSGIRSIVRPLEESDLHRLEAIRWCPTQFQAFVPGVNVRVHVVGGDIFATAIRTNMTDYRYVHRESSTQNVIFEPCVLPDETANACVRVTAALGLSFAGVDLKITPEGHVYCFEVNPSPAFNYYQERTGQPVARAVARFLRGTG
jgi:glutathione synthase/RimK-type ligase-like ATP-grasp enzyme